MKRAAAIVSAAAILLGATPALAAQSAKQFIEHAYAPWTDATQKRISDTDLMSPEFMALWRANDKAADKADEIGYIDGNLMCSCQDGQMTALHISVRDINATRATAHVTFDMDTEARDQLMLLKFEHGRWYIDDIIEGSKTSLVARLREDTRMRGKKAH